MCPLKPSQKNHQPLGEFENSPMCEKFQNSHLDKRNFNFPHIHKILWKSKTPWIFKKNLVGEIIDFHTTKILEIVEILKSTHSCTWIKEFPTMEIFQTTKVFSSHMYMKLHNSLLHHGNICNQSSAQKPKCTHEIMKFCEFSWKLHDYWKTTSF